MHGVHHMSYSDTHTNSKKWTRVEEDGPVNSQTTSPYSV